MKDKICPKCKGNGFCNAPQKKVEYLLLKIAIFVTYKEKCMIKNLMSILILMLSLSHCSSTNFIAIGGGIYSGLEDKPNPIGAIKMIMEKDKKDE